jgi:hypothetical protein
VSHPYPPAVAPITDGNHFARFSSQKDAQRELVKLAVPVRRFFPLRGAELVLTSGGLAGHLPAETARTSTSFTIFEDTSEIQRMIIGRASTGLDVR